MQSFSDSNLVVVLNKSTSMLSDVVRLQLFWTMNLSTQIVFMADISHFFLWMVLPIHGGYGSPDGNWGLAGKVWGLSCYKFCYLQCVLKNFRRDILRKVVYLTKIKYSCAEYLNLYYFHSSFCYFWEMSMKSSIQADDTIPGRKKNYSYFSLLEESERWGKVY